MTPAALAASVTALLGRAIGPVEPLAVAVSGGPDSLALLWLAHAAFGGRVRALTVEHGLRPGSPDTAVAAAAAGSLGVPHATLAWTGAKPSANRQAAARAARYALMRDWCAARGVAWLVTAHSVDDQAETLLLRLARGAGSGGLAGIRPRRALGGGVTLLRPLLGATRTSLAAIVAAAGWTAADDPSNRSPAFDRTHARALLAATPWLAPARLAASAAHLADDDAALTWTADRAWASRVDVSGATITIDAAGLPHALQRRLIVRAVTTLDTGAMPRGPAVERLLGRLAAGSGGTLAGIGARCSAQGGKARWLFRPAPPRRQT